jgi:hypothetical protein
MNQTLHTKVISILKERHRQSFNSKVSSTSVFQYIVVNWERKFVCAYVGKNSKAYISVSVYELLLSGNLIEIMALLIIKI